MMFLITNTLKKGLQEALDFREELGNIYNLNLLNESKSGLGSKLSELLFAKETNDKSFLHKKTIRDKIKYSDVIFEHIEPRTKIFSDFINNLKQLTLDVRYISKDSSLYIKNYIKDNFTFNMLFFDLPIVFGIGGLHGCPEKPTLFTNKDNLLIDIDAASFYPWIKINNKIFPKHLGSAYISFYRKLTERRMDYKFQGNKLKANGLKIAINKLFGSMGFKESWLYDYKAFLKTTINGQLYLMSLIEILYLAGFKTVYANTDGITCVVPKDKIDKFRVAYKAWEQSYGFNLEEDLFKKMFVRDVNNFLVKKEDNKIKARGVYKYDSYIEKYGEFDVSNSFTNPIVSLAAKCYLLDDTSIEDTIRNHKDIFDFCICRKTGSQFKNILRNGDTEEQLQQTIRYFISNSNNKLFKIKKVLKKVGIQDITMSDGTVLTQTSLFDLPKEVEINSETDVSVGRNITIFNDYFKSENYNIDYEYYILETKKLIDEFK